MRYWLMKSEPSEFSIDDLQARPDQTEPWDGVRNYQARNMMRDEMKRGDRVFVDYLRNGYAQTVVAPYTVRARPGAPVSTPLTWDELTDSDLNAQKYKIGDVLARLGKMRDPWHELAKHARSLPRARAKLGS